MSPTSCHRSTLAPVRLGQTCRARPECRCSPSWDAEGDETQQGARPSPCKTRWNSTACCYIHVLLQIAGMVIAPVAFIFILYALFMYKKRTIQVT